MIPARGKVLLRRVETAPSIPGGKILLTERTRGDLTSQQMEILARGRLAYCEDEDCERPHIDLRVISSGKPILAHGCGAKKGDWVLVAHRSLLETDQDGIYVVSQDDVLAILEP